MNRKMFVCLLAVVFVPALGWGKKGDGEAVKAAKGLKYAGAYKLKAKKNLLAVYPPFAEKGLVNAVVEIPAGTDAKWEVSPSGKTLEWKMAEEMPLRVDYLPYPGNYGMIPGTLMAKEAGGDGDPLDILILGPSVPRGTVIPVKLIGVLKLKDNGEKDDKILAVAEGTPLYAVSSIRELNHQYGGVSTILETWFLHYKGLGKIETQGFGSKGEAVLLIREAAEAYQKANPQPEKK